MNIDEPGDEHIIDEDFHGAFDENLFNELVVDDNLFDDLNINIPNMEGARQGAGQQGPQRMVVVDPMKNLPKFSGEKTESADNHLDAFDDYLEIQQIDVADANVAQIITRFGYSLFGKAKKWFNQGRDGRPHANVADWNALKEQFKQQFNPVGNTREEQMASWRNIKWDGNETLDEFSYRVTQLGKALGLNDQHILDTFKLGLPSNIYVNLVHIDGMQATLNMAKRLMAVSKGTSPGASAISNIPFMVASNHDGLNSGIYQKPDIAKQVTFQDSALLSGLQKINKKLNSLDNDLNALRSERSRREFKSPGRQRLRNRNRSRDNSRDSSRDTPDRDRRNAKRVNRSRNKSRNNSRDRSNDRARNGRNDSRQKSSRHCEYCDQDGHTWKYCWEMQANAKKARRLKEMDDRDDDPSDTFNSMVSEDIISDDDINDFISNFSDMTELN